MLPTNETAKHLFLYKEPCYDPGKRALIRAELTSLFIIHGYIIVSSATYSAAGNLAWENNNCVCLIIRDIAKIL